MSKLVDLSHNISNGMVTYRGLPGPKICDYWSFEESAAFYDDGSEFQISQIEMVANTGTYLDCPAHRLRHGKDLSMIPLEWLVDLEAVLIYVPWSESREIGKKYFEGYLLENKAVIVCTGWDEFWQTDSYYENHPYLTSDAAEFLASQKVRLVGIDSHNIDNTSEKKRPVHTILLSNEILIVEHLCKLRELINSRFTFTAVPPKIHGFGTFPVRALAKIID